MSVNGAAPAFKRLVRGQKSSVPQAMAMQEPGKESNNQYTGARGGKWQIERCCCVAVCYWFLFVCKTKNETEK